MLAVGSATGGQVRFRIGRDRVQQRDCVERTQQRKHQDGGKAAHLIGSVHHRLVRGNETLAAAES